MRHPFRGKRRAFLKSLGMASAGFAAVWSRLIPEAKAQQPGDPSVNEPSDLSEAEIAVLAQRAGSSPDVARLLARLPGPTVPAVPIAGQRLIENDVEYSFIAIPYAPASAPDVTVAYVVFGALTGLAAEALGYTLPAAMASYYDGTAFAATEGQIARFLDPAVEARVYDQFWGPFDTPPTSSPAGGGALAPSSLRGRTPAKSGFRYVMQAEATCDDPRVKDCTALCRGSCAYAGIWNAVRCGLMVLLCVGVVITTGPMPGIVTCSVMVLVCGTTVAIERGCNECRRECRDYNRAVCADAARNGRA